MVHRDITFLLVMKFTRFPQLLEIGHVEKIQFHCSPLTFRVDETLTFFLKKSVNYYHIIGLNRLSKLVYA